MAFFKFRKASDDGSSVPVQPPSVESIRQRAKYRLAGATVLVLVGVVGFPLLFDKQPRPIAVDTPITIPDKDKVLPLAVPVEPASAPVAAATVAASAETAVAAAVKPREELITESAEPAKSDSKPDSKPAAAPLKSQKPASAAAAPVAKEPVKPAKAAESTQTAKQSEAARVQSLLDGQPVTAKPAEVKAPKSAETASAAEGGRFVVQVGSFADEGRAREVRLKLERAGLKTYTHVAETKEGKRIRVRVGPFAAKAEASKTADKIKKLSLPAAILSL